MSELGAPRKHHESCIRRNPSEMEEGEITCAGFEEALLTTQLPEEQGRVACPCCGWRPRADYIWERVRDQEQLLEDVWN